MAQYTAEQIADTLIHLSKERGREITNLKLQKLLYYAQAWHLVFEQNTLFDDDIEAWVHGPVVPGVFRKFKQFRWGAINCDVAPLKDKHVIEHLNIVLDAYENCSAKQLEQLAHSEDPWKNARKGIPIDEPSHSVISVDSMRDFYACYLTEEKK